MSDGTVICGECGSNNIVPANLRELMQARDVAVADLAAARSEIEALTLERDRRSGWSDRDAAVEARADAESAVEKLKAENYQYHLIASHADDIACHDLGEQLGTGYVDHSVVKDVADLHARGSAALASLTAERAAHQVTAARLEEARGLLEAGNPQCFDASTEDTVAWYARVRAFLAAATPGVPVASVCELVDCRRQDPHNHSVRCEHRNPGDGSCDNCRCSSAEPRATTKGGE